MTLIERVSMNFATAHPARSRATIITGNRGIGKTSLLAASIDRAHARGIPVLRANGKRGFLDDIHYAVNHLIDQLADKPGMTLQDISVSLTAFGTGASMRLRGGRIPSDRTIGTFGASLKMLVDRLVELGKPGLLVVIDELNFKYARDLTLDHVVTFSSAYQALIEDGSRIGIVVSGLPIPIERAKRNQHISFLNRAESISLREFSYGESREAIRKLTGLAGVDADDDAVQMMAALSRGNTYMLQEAGYLAYEHSATGSIRRADVEAIRDTFMEKAISSVAGVAFDELSNKEKAIISAIAHNPEVSPKELASALEAKETSLPQMRKNLVDAGILVADVHQRGRFLIGFPYMKEYVLHHAEGSGDPGAYQRIMEFPDV